MEISYYGVGQLISNRINQTSQFLGLLEAEFISHDVKSATQVKLYMIH